MTQTRKSSLQRESLLATYHSSLVREMVENIEKICQPAAANWRKQMRRYLATALFGPLHANESLSRERINALLQEVQMHAAVLNPRPTGRSAVLLDTTSNKASRTTR